MPRLRFYGWTGIVFLAFIAALGVMLGSLYFVWRGEIQSEVASLLNTAALVIVTAIYALITFLLLGESIKDREQRVAPTLVLDVQEDPPIVVVENIGNGPAINLTIITHLAPGPDPPQLRIDDTHLKVSDTISLFEGDLHNLRFANDELYQEYDGIVVEFYYTTNTGKSDSDSATKALSEIEPGLNLPA